MYTFDLNVRLPYIALGAFFFFTTFECTASLISDEIFNDSSWRSTLISSAGGATHTVQQELNGGNPGEYRFMLHDFSGAGNIQVFHEYLDASYSPSVQGAISTITYREDRIVFNPFFSGAAIGSAAAIMQDGRVFLAPSATYTNTSWETLLQESLTALDFIANDLSNPNFLDSGGEITFGYVRFNSTGGFTPQTEHGIDNWSVNINPASVPVPVPATVWLFGAGLIRLIGMKKKSSKLPTFSA